MQWGPISVFLVPHTHLGTCSAGKLCGVAESNIYFYLTRIVLVPYNLLSASTWSEIVKVEVSRNENFDHTNTSRVLSRKATTTTATASHTEKYICRRRLYLLLLLLSRNKISQRQFTFSVCVRKLNQYALGNKYHDIGSSSSMQ
jgi:hypothetical protein